MKGDNAAAEGADERNKGVIFKNCAPFDCNWTRTQNHLNLPVWPNG